MLLFRSHKIDAAKPSTLESNKLGFRRFMPLYEYECKKCHHRFERIQKFSDPHIKKCPDCGGAVEQVISAPAVQFKGSGWYVTDYAKKSSAPPSETSSAKKDDKSKSDSKSESKSESKPEATKKKAEKH
jgi:putative FmdB family regulatory protein